MRVYTTIFCSCSSSSDATDHFSHRIHNFLIQLHYFVHVSKTSSFELFKAFVSMTYGLDLAMILSCFQISWYFLIDKWNFKVSWSPKAISQAIFLYVRTYAYEFSLDAVLHLIVIWYFNLKHISFESVEDLLLQKIAALTETSKQIFRTFELLSSSFLNSPAGRTGWHMCWPGRAGPRGLVLWLRSSLQINDHKTAPANISVNSFPPHLI